MKKLEVKIVEKTTHNSGYLTINGQMIAYKDLNSDFLTLRAVGSTKLKLAKLFTGIENENVFNIEAIGTLEYKGSRKTFGEIGYFKGFNLAYLPLVQETPENLGDALVHRINTVNAWVKHIDWLKKDEVFGFNNKRIEIKRITSNKLNLFPLRFTIEGEKLTIDWMEFIEKLIRESFEDRSKYLTFFKPTAKGFCVTANVKGIEKQFVICPFKEPEIGEFKGIINTAIVSTAKFVEKCLAEQKTKQHTFDLSNKSQQLSLFELLQNNTYKINDFKPRGSVNPFILDGLGKTIVERDKEIAELTAQNENLYKAKSEILTQLTHSITERNVLRIELNNANDRNELLKGALLNANNLLQAFELRESKLNEIDELTNKIEKMKR